MLKHFSEKRKAIKPIFFDDKTYGQILDSIVIACVDAFFIHNNQIMLTKRKVYPRRDWWGLGGRMISGENPLDSLKRKLFEETTLNIEPYRFIFFGIYSTNFYMRQQIPQDNGTHTLNPTFYVEITEEEKNKIKLINKEYKDYRWVKLDEIDKIIDKKDYLTNILNDLKEKVLNT
jgi:ADP-ribose pyrophosphatase YjhB (NUDIX family)